MADYQEEETQDTCPECGHDAEECLLCIDMGCGACDCGCECEYLPQHY